MPQVKAQQAEIRSILHSTGAQAKFANGQPKDKYEQEADRVATQVTAMPDPRLQRHSENKGKDETVQAKKNDTPIAASSNVGSDMGTLWGNGQPLPLSTRAYFEPRIGADFSDVRVNTDLRAAQTAKSINAKAFTRGTNIVFAEGQYSPGDLSGRHLLAHELTHVVQQRGGHASNTSPVIQCKRLPGQLELTELVDNGNYNLPAHREGLVRLIALAMAEMTPEEIKYVRRTARKGISLRTFYRMSKWKRNLRLAKAIYDFNKEFRHGDPKKSEKPARPRSKVKTLHDKARYYMSMISTGNTYDKSIGQVFGQNIKQVKGNFKKAHAALGRLYVSDKILTDRSGYMKEVGLGAEANTSEMNLSPEMIDQPTATPSIIKTIHESLHAGNYGTMKGDPGGYNDGSKRFREVSEANKLNNPDHYTVVVWRILKPKLKYAHQGKTFKPVVRKITRRTGARTASFIAITEGAKKAMQTFTSALSVAVTLHGLIREVYLKPHEWNFRPPYKGRHKKSKYNNTLPYWSKVENLTIHKKTKINPYLQDQSRHPVSITDVALSEGVCRRLNLTRNYISDNPATTLAFINKYESNKVWMRARRSVSRTRDLLIERILRHKVRNITGNPTRDYEAVKHLAAAKKNGLSSILKPRKPSLFPYP